MGFAVWGTGTQSQLLFLQIYEFCYCRFSSNNEDHILQLALKDKIRFHCPHYGGRWSSIADREYYVIYRVCTRVYSTCRPSSHLVQTVQAANCSQNIPKNKRIYFQKIIHTQGSSSCSKDSEVIGCKYYVIYGPNTKWSHQIAIWAPLN